MTKWIWQVRLADGSTFTVDGVGSWEAKDNSWWFYEDDPDPAVDEYDLQVLAYANNPQWVHRLGKQTEESE